MLVSPPALIIFRRKGRGLVGIGRSAFRSAGRRLAFTPVISPFIAAGAIIKKTDSRLAAIFCRNDLMLVPLVEAKLSGRVWEIGCQAGFWQAFLDTAGGEGQQQTEDQEVKEN